MLLTYSVWIALAVLCVIPTVAMAQTGVFVDGVTYVQYTDDAVALADVGAGRLDIHYGGLGTEHSSSQSGAQILESQSGSYSLLVNPASGGPFNLFADTTARYALNYIVDRGLVVNEMLGGRGSPMHLAYAAHDPDYVAVASRGIPQFSYDPARAERLISGALERAGAIKENETWMFDNNPVVIKVFIRSDDLVRKSIGELLSQELENIGLAVERQYGDLNKAFVIVYGSDPASLLWNVYTEGWGGKAGFVRYDPTTLAQMYAPWFSAMPGFNDPSYWNYEHNELDEITGQIYSGEFANANERDQLLWRAANIGVSESVRVFIASGSLLYAAGSEVDGIVNDFGAGVPSRFTPINAQTPSGHLRVGVQQIYQGAWNPVMGFSDIHSSRIWATLADPAIFRHPYTGSPIPVRASWDVQTMGPEPSIPVPPSAVLWDVESQSWQGAPSGTLASSAVTLDLAMSEWHHGQMMDINDIMYSAYFVTEWGTEQEKGDPKFDSEFASRAAQSISTLRGIEQIDETTLRIYVDYWHFDDAEIASWASAWAGMPWELYAGMEEAVSSMDVSFSRSGAAASGVPWLSLITKSDASIVAKHIEELQKISHIPKPLEQLGSDTQYVSQRYNAALEWIDEHDHAVISNGPFYLERYLPESRTILTRAFDSASYPFEQGHWLYLADVSLPRITKVEIPKVHHAGDPLDILVATQNTSRLHYIISETGKGPVASGELDVHEGQASIGILPEATAQIQPGTMGVSLYAVSDDVLRPDTFQTGLVVAAKGVKDLSTLAPTGEPASFAEQGTVTITILAIASFVIVLIAILWRLRSRTLSQL